jgi:hypothetical protein
MLLHIRLTVATYSWKNAAVALKPLCQHRRGTDYGTQDGWKEFPHHSISNQLESEIQT